MLLNSERHIDRRGADVNMISYCSITLHVYRNIKQQMFLLYNECMSCISCHFGPLKPLTLGVDHAKLLRRSDVTSCKPCNITIVPCALQCQVRQTMQHVVISAAEDRHRSQSEDVYL